MFPGKVANGSSSPIEGPGSSHAIVRAARSLDTDLDETRLLAIVLAAAPKPGALLRFQRAFALQARVALQPWHLRIWQGHKKAARVLKLAKHETMNERKRLLPQSASEIVCPPAFPIPGNNIFERIGTAVSASRGFPLENIDFARLIGRSASTTSHWFGVFSQPHLVSCFCLLEQLPPLERYRVVDSLCRELPLFDHPRLRHNPVVATTMKKLLTQSTGLTLLVGGTDEQRTFLITALGHTFCRIDRRHRNVAGIDLHDPHWFVPVETMLYLKGPADQAHAGGLVRRIWPEIVSTKKPIVLLNAIWSALPELRNDILSLATRRHVIVADQQIAVPRGALQVDHPLHTLSVSTARENANWIAVQATRL